MPVSKHRPHPGNISKPNKEHPLETAKTCPNQRPPPSKLPGCPSNPPVENAKNPRTPPGFAGLPSPATATADGKLGGPRGTAPRSEAGTG